MKQAEFKPYKFGASNLARALRHDAKWIQFMRDNGFSPSHPDFNPNYTRSVAQQLRDGAARIIAGDY